MDTAVVKYFMKIQPVVLCEIANEQTDIETDRHTDKCQVNITSLAGVKSKVTAIAMLFSFFCDPTFDATNVVTQCRHLNTEAVSENVKLD